MHLFQQPTTPGFLASQLLCLSLMLVMLGGAMKFTTAEEALGFYGVYHSEPINLLIHFFGVPCISWSLLLFTAHLPFPYLESYSVSIPFTSRHSVNWATCLFVGYFFMAIKIDLIGGLLYVPFEYSMYAITMNLVLEDQQTAKKLSSNAKTVSWTGTGKLLQLAAFLHVLGWYLQIHPGHAIVEGGKPALLESLGGALTTAPLFAFYEGLWLLGINKQLQQRMLEKVAEHVVRMCGEGVALRACANL